MKALWDVISQRAEKWYLHACSSGNWSTPKFKGSCLDLTSGDCKPTMTVSCTLRSFVLSMWAFKILSPWTLLLKKIGIHHLLSDTSFGGPNIELVRIEWSLHSNNWDLRYLWVSVGDWWVWVAGHHAESLNRICILQFWHWSSSSCDRAQTCRDYCTMSKVRSKHTTQSISSWVGFPIGQVCAFMIQWYRVTFLQWRSWHEADNSRQFSSSLHIPIKHKFINWPRLSGTCCLHLNMKGLENIQWAIGHIYMPLSFSVTPKLVSNVCKSCGFVMNKRAMSYIPTQVLKIASTDFIDNGIGKYAVNDRSYGYVLKLFQCTGPFSKWLQQLWLCHE
jgi:hypothetical protein